MSARSPALAVLRQPGPQPLEDAASLFLWLIKVVFTQEAKPRLFPADQSGRWYILVPRSTATETPRTSAAPWARLYARFLVWPLPVPLPPHQHVTEAWKGNATCRMTTRPRAQRQWQTTIHIWFPSSFWEPSVRRKWCSWFVFSIFLKIKPNTNLPSF